MLFVYVFIGTFVASLLGNVLNFKNRFGNALSTAIVGALLTYGVNVAAGAPLMITAAIAQVYLIVAAFIFVASLAGNLVTFSNRIANALATAAIAAALVYFGLRYII